MNKKKICIIAAAAVIYSIVLVFITVQADRAVIKKSIKNTVIDALSDYGSEAQTSSEPTASVSSAPNSKDKSSQTRQITAAELDNLVSELEFSVISTKYAVQDEKHKSLYPDMLQAVVKNDTQSDIKNAVVAFIAWDSNNLPVKIKGNIDFSDGSYIKQCNFNDINLIPGAAYGENKGMGIDEDCNIAAFKAFAVSYETFEGEKWENPYKNIIEQMYGNGIKYSDDLSIEVKESDLVH